MALGLAIGLAFFFWPAGGPSSPREESAAPGAGRMFLGLSQYYLDDQAARTELRRLAGLDLPALARVVRVDAAGTWSRIYLGPFETSEETEAAARRLEDNPSAPAPRPEDEAAGRPSARPQILVELTALVKDEDLFDELEHPRRRNIPAFARTAEVALKEGGRAYNRFCLGPFAHEAEALEALSRLRDWPLTADFSLRRLETAGD